MLNLNVTFFDSLDEIPSRKQPVIVIMQDDDSYDGLNIFKCAEGILEDEGYYDAGTAADDEEEDRTPFEAYEDYQIYVHSDAKERFCKWIQVYEERYKLVYEYDEDDCCEEPEYHEYDDGDGCDEPYDYDEYGLECHIYDDDEED